MKRKLFFKILNISLIALFVILVPCFALKKARDYEIYKEPEIKTKIYTVWHIETFEGGGKSRITYLNTIARAIEKENAGILIMVKSINPDLLADELNNSTPDIVSFGYGVGQLILDKLKPFTSTYDVRDELINSGSFNDELYAIPYIASGYALITHGTGTGILHCGTTGYTKPENVYNSLNLSPAENESQYEAYKDFVYKKDVSLLGTGRDVFRVNNLNKIGRTNASIKPIDTYTDLIQYLGKITDDKITNKFIALSLSNKYQNSISEYSLFSTKYNKLYADGIYNDMEEAIYKCYVPKVFDK